MKNTTICDKPGCKGEYYKEVDRIITSYDCDPADLYQYTITKELWYRDEGWLLNLPLWALENIETL